MFRYFNPNPLHDGNKKGWKHVDCTVRSICAATGLTWVEAYKKLCDAGLKRYVMPHDMIAYNEVLKSLGFSRVKSCGKKENIHVKDLAKKSKKERKIYLIKVNNHVVCLKGGDIYDTWDSSECIIQQYWEKEDKAEK